MNSDRFFTIGDIHGQSDLLKDLLDSVRIQYHLDLTKDKLIFLGDYVDRGPDSAGVLAEIKGLCEVHPQNVIALRGNHEDMAIDACLKPTYNNHAMWMYNGGDSTVRSYKWLGESAYMDPEHIKWLASLPNYHLEPGFFFSHAPVPKDELRRIAGDYSNHELTWTYFDFVDEEDHAKKWNDKVGVCGHIHRLREGFITAPRMYPHYIYVDTGAGCHPKAPLTCIEVVSREVIQAWPKDPMSSKEIEDIFKTKDNADE